ncbi:hypothetical protein Ciccas_009906, partial [Cichlidogyrus casuarinus]
TFAAVDGKTGDELWYFDFGAEESPMDFYTPQFIPDLDRDGIPDMIQMYGAKTASSSTPAQLKLFSGRSGKELYSQVVPDRSVGQASPIMVTLGDRIPAIIFGTGSDSQSGTMFVVRLDDFIEGSLAHKARSILSGREGKGIVNSPVMADLTGDRFPDLVSCPYNDGCVALDPRNNFKPLWTFSANSSVTQSLPAFGKFTEDAIPDIFVQLSYASNSGSTLFTQASILDGRTGVEVKEVHLSQGGVVSSPLVMSMQGMGNDIFLFWGQSCQGQTKVDKSFVTTNRFLSQKKENSLFQYDERDACLQKYGTNSTLQLLAFSRSFGLKEVFSTQSHDKDEFSTLATSSQRLDNFLQGHPISRNPDGIPSRQTFSGNRGYSVNDLSLRSKRNVMRTPKEKTKHALSTGTLAPPLPVGGLETSLADSMDVVFATFWTESKEADRKKSTEEQECVDKWLDNEAALRQRPGSQYYRMDSEKYLSIISQKCALLYHGSEDLDINTVPNGQLTIYRKRITCKCAQADKSKCGRPLTFAQQSWSQFLGLNSTGYWEEFRTSP